MTLAPLLLHVFPSFAVGGAQVRFAALANHYGPRWRHVVVPLDGCGDCAQRIDPSVELHLVEPPARSGLGAMGLVRIAGLLARLRPALLVTSNWGSMDWAIANRLFSHLPHLHTEDGFGPEEAGGQLRRRVLARRLVLGGSTVVLPSATLQRLATKAWHMPEAQLRQIPNGLDLARFNPKGPVAPGFEGTAPLIGSVAALRPEKNIARLLRAAALLHEEAVPLRLAILGDGPQRARLEVLARNLGIGRLVHFAGHVADPAAAYRAMDILALSSDTEQMPFAVLEAMATGLPVAATDVGDISSMVSLPNLPHLSALEDIALADALRPLLLNARLRRHVGEANRAKAEADYDEEAMFRSYATLIDQAIAPGHRP